MAAVAPSDAAPSVVWIPCNLSATGQACLRVMNGMVHAQAKPSSPVGFAWYSMLGSYLQHVSYPSIATFARLYR